MADPAATTVGPLAVPPPNPVATDTARFEWSAQIRELVCSPAEVLVADGVPSSPHGSTVSEASSWVDCASPLEASPKTLSPAPTETTSTSITIGDVAASAAKSTCTPITVEDSQGSSPASPSRTAQLEVGSRLIWNHLNQSHQCSPASSPCDSDNAADLSVEESPPPPPRPISSDEEEDEEEEEEEEQEEEDVDNSYDEDEEEECGSRSATPAGVREVEESESRSVSSPTGSTSASSAFAHHAPDVQSDEESRYDTDPDHVKEEYPLQVLPPRDYPDESESDQDEEEEEEDDDEEEEFSSSSEDQSSSDESTQTDSFAPADGGAADAPEEIAEEASSSNSPSSKSDLDTPTRQQQVRDMIPVSQHEDLMLQLAARIRLLEEANQELLLAQQDASRPRCAFPSCTGIATYWCVECAELCDAHVLPVHSASSWSSHVWIPVSEKAAHLQRQQEAKYRAKLVEMRARIDKGAKAAAVLRNSLIGGGTMESASSSSESSAQSAASHDLATSAAAIEAFESQSQSLVSSWKASLAYVRAHRAELDTTRAHLSERVREAASRIAELKRLTDSELLRRVGDLDELAELDDIDSAHRAYLEAREEAQPDDVVGRVATAAIGAVRALPLLHTLSIEALRSLQTFIGDAKLDGARQLYKASRDGFTASDFFRRCTDQGPTLTLIKSSENGFVFGAYTGVAWPKPPAERSPQVNVPDPTGRSCLFSLVNAYSRPFRMSLVDRTRAIRVHPTDGPCFGGEVRDADGEVVKYGNLLLMLGGQPAHEDRSNFWNHPVWHGGAYQLDAWSGARDKNPPPAGFKLDMTTFAGKVHFAAEEIECYAI